MVTLDTKTAPEEDICVIKDCGRSRRDHGAYANSLGHLFTSAAQLAAARRQPADPLRDVRKMTDEERAGWHSAIAKGKPHSQAGTRPIAQAAVAARVVDPNFCRICRKPKASHRGSIGHSFNGEAPLRKQYRAKPGEICAICSRPAISHRGKNAMAFGHRYKPGPAAPDAPPPPVAPEAEPLLPKGWMIPPPAPSVRTRAMIMDAVERAIQSINLGSHVRLDDTRVVTESSIDNDAHIIAAEVTAKFSIVFGTRQDDEDRE